jgi:hypothetical protein
MHLLYTIEFLPRTKEKQKKCKWANEEEEKAEEGSSFLSPQEGFLRKP